VSNPHPGRFLDLLEQTEGPVLDCGSGGRYWDRVINLDPVHTPWNTITADGCALPFRDGSFTLVLSQAVLEHVERPHDYIDEIYRVLKPGGKLYLEVAFIQPVHMAPMHFRNYTPFGVQYECRAFEEIELGSLGWFSETIAWLCRESGVRAPRVSEPKPDKALNAASGVYFLGRKPDHSRIS
jgi:SAM-dependent methyltransferase